MKKIKKIEITIDILDVLEIFEFQIKELRFLTIDEKGNLNCEVLDRLILDEVIESEIYHYIEREKLQVEYTGNYTKKIDEGIIFVEAEVKGGE